MSEPTRAPALLWSRVHCRSCKRMFSACVKLRKHLVELNRDYVKLSYFAAAHIVHSSGCRFHLTLFKTLARRPVNHVDSISKENILPLATKMITLLKSVLLL